MTGGWALSEDLLWTGVNKMLSLEPHKGHDCMENDRGLDCQAPANPFPELFLLSNSIESNREVCSQRISYRPE